MGGLPYSLLSAKSMRWCCLTDWKVLPKIKGLFSDMQFGFKEGVGCTEASFTILEAINHMVERGSNVFTCFLEVRKAFDCLD